MKKLLITFLLFLSVVGISTSSSNSNNNTQQLHATQTKYSWGWHRNHTGWYFGDRHGHYNRLSWHKINGTWYWFDASGYIWNYYGWYHSHSGWLYNRGSNGSITSKIKRIHNTEYYFDRNAIEHKRASYSTPVKDMRVSQDLHVGLSVDYQPRGCYLRPGCVSARSITSGTAYPAYWGPYGKQVVVDHHNGLCTRYAHLNSYNVKWGQHVKSGQSVGRLGQTGRATGVHLHFEIRSGSGHHCDGPMLNPHSFGY